MMHRSTAAEVEDVVVDDIGVSSTGDGVGVGVSSGLGGQQNATSIAYAYAHALDPDSKFTTLSMRSAHVKELSSYSGT